MTRHTPLFLAGLIAAVLAVVVTPRLIQHMSPPAPVAPVEVRTPPAKIHPQVGFATPERLVEHFRKHGREFGAATADEYLRLAQALRDRPAGGDVLEAVRADGIVLRFDQASGAFVAFAPDLTVRTFFKPRDGEAYFRRQLERERGR